MTLNLTVLALVLIFGIALLVIRLNKLTKRINRRAHLLRRYVLLKEGEVIGDVKAAIRLIATSDD